MRLLVYVSSPYSSGDQAANVRRQIDVGHGLMDRGHSVLVKRAPERVVAPVPAQPVGWNKAHPTYMRDLSMKSWAPELMKRDPKVTPDMIERFLTRMFPNPDFLFTVNRDFVRNCHTPMLILLDDTPGHPYDVAWETAMLAPKSELAHYPWKDPKEMIPIAVRQVRSFLRAHRPAQ